MTGAPDWNDRHNAGTMPGEIPWDGAESMPPPPDPGAPPRDPDDPGPEASGEPPHEEGTASGPPSVADLPWISPGPEWLTEEPPVRLYLLHDAPAPQSPYGTRGPGMLPRGKAGILAAGGGVGKTYALTGLALAVVTGRPWLGHFPTADGLAGRVALVLGEEDAGEVRRRLYLQARAMGLGSTDGKAVGAGLLVLPGAGLDRLALTRSEEVGEVRTPFAADLRAFLEERGPWDAVILDPLARFAGPDVETDNAAATRLIQVLEGFASLPGGPSVLVAHHTRKTSATDQDPSGANSIRGASALVNGARWAALLVDVPRPAGSSPDLPRFVRFAVRKSNYAPPNLDPDGLLLAHAYGGGLRVATAAERRALEDAQEAAKDAPRGRAGGPPRARGNPWAERAAGEPSPPLTV
ncbi:MAG: AAA family ATPase [Deltaproteobacteria bacterium]|nr:AAA family ATPase [Deltaproteobacteria bacterium]